MTLATLDAPVRVLFEQLDQYNGPVPDMDGIGRILVEFAEDTEYLQHHIDRIRDKSGAAPIHCPERGPRLQIVHRLTGQMGAIHSHKVWIAATPVEGTETHRLYGVRGSGVTLKEETHLAPGQFVTLTPPNDVHAHGHVQGIGDAAYCLIFAGDDQRRFEREEYDAKTGAMRTLPVGDGGAWVAS